MFEKLFGKKVEVTVLITDSTQPDRVEDTNEVIESPQPLVKYILENIPLMKLPIDSVGLFAEDSRTLFQALLPKGVIIVPVGVYRVSETKWNFYNWSCKLVGGIVLSENGEKLKFFGKDFQPKFGWVNYKLMNLAFEDDLNILRLFSEKFNILQQDLLVVIKEKKSA